MIPTRRMLCLLASLLWTAGGLAVLTSAADPQALAEGDPAAGLPVRRVLVIDQEVVTRPSFVQFMEGFRAGMAEAKAIRSELFIETLDITRLGLRVDEIDESVGWLLQKYAGTTFDVICATSGVALEFAIASRPRLSPAATILAFTRPGEQSLQLENVPRITFASVGSPIGSTLDLAARLFPQTRRLAFVGQAEPHPRMTAQMVSEAQVYAALHGYEFISLVDLPLAGVRQRLRDLPPDSVVFYQGYWKDELGRLHVPAEILETLCSDSVAPVFGWVDSYVGRGIVGGVCGESQVFGRMCGEFVLGCHDGQVPTSIEATGRTMLDARALHRFGVPQNLVPAGSRIQFQEPRLLDRYWPQILGGVALVALQTGFIVALVRQMRGRRRAERIVREQRDQIAHAGRVSTLGQLAASLAHELGQPLGAILNNIEAAEIILRDDDSENAPELRAIVADIAADDRRAGAVLDRIRAMVRKQRFTVGPVDVPRLIRDVLSLVGPGLASDGIAVSVACDPGVPLVAGDAILLQQALLNLLGNSAEAIRAREAASSAGPQASARTRGGRGEGQIAIRAAWDGVDGVSLTVVDNGGGIGETPLNRFLEPFHTTKEQGLGMGLSIVQSIVEQHEGRLRLENIANHGLSVSLCLPAWDQRKTA